MQALIVLDYLATHSESAEKSKVNTRMAVQRITLSDAQEKSIRDMRGTILNHLMSFGPSPDVFVRAVTSFLKLEDFWVFSSVQILQKPDL